MSVVCSLIMKTLGEIAKYVDGELQGDPGVVITRILHPALVREPNDLALVLSANVLDFLKQNQATNAIAPADLKSIDVPNYILVSRPQAGSGPAPRAVRASGLLRGRDSCNRGDRSDRQDRRKG